MEAVLAHDLGRSPRACSDEIAALGIRFASVDGDDNWHVDPVPRAIARRRLGAGRGRPRAARARAQRVHRRHLRATAGSSPRACCRSACSTARRTSSPRCWACSRATASGSASRASTSCATTPASGWCSRTTCARRAASPTGSRRARRCCAGSTSRSAPRRSTASRMRCGASSATGAWSCSPTGRRTPPTGSTTGSRAQLEHPARRRRPTSSCAASACSTTASRSTASTAAPTPTRSTRTSARCSRPRVRAGSIKLTNCFGNGIADDKLAHAHVEDMVRFYLGEEPLLAQVETFDLGEPRHARAGARRVRRAGDQGPRLLWRRSASSSARTPSAPTWRSCASACARPRPTSSRSGWSSSRRTRP